jgi:hypothetical protein
MNARIWIAATLLSISSLAFAEFDPATDDDDTFCSLQSRLKGFQYKATVQQFQNLLKHCNGYFEVTSNVTSQSTSDGHLVKIRIYGPEEQPFLVLYSVNEIIIGYKILRMY